MSNMPSAINIFDRAQIRQNRNRATKSITDHDFLLRWSDEQLQQRLREVKRRFLVGLQIGARTAARHDQIGTLIQMDLAEKTLASKLSVQADEEALPFADNSLDAVLSNLSLHSVNDLPGALIQINRALKPDGLFLAAMLGGESLYELRACLMQAELEIAGGASPRIAPFADKLQTAGLMQRTGYALPVVDSEIVTVTYDNIFKLMHDLRGMGEGNAIAARAKNLSNRALFLKAAELYAQNYSDHDGRLRATFEILFMIGWAPHESQAKPLRPGSARHSLAEALGTQELQTGERAAP